MSKYFLFAGICYYPEGGHNDLREVIQCSCGFPQLHITVDLREFDWEHIMDDQGKRVWTGNDDHLTSNV